MSDESREPPEWLTSTLAADALESAGALPPAIRPLELDYHIAGRVSVVTIARDDNLDLREALARGPQPGRILVVAGGEASMCACMGGLMAREALLQGFSALITSAPVRDGAEIRASGLLVWARGHSPTAPRKHGGGQVGGTAHFGAVNVRPGDFVVADEDGIVIWPWERHADLLARAQARMESDEHRARALDARLNALRAGQAE